MEDVKEEIEEHDEDDNLNVQENEEYDFNMFLPPSVQLGEDDN